VCESWRITRREEIAVTTAAGLEVVEGATELERSDGAIELVAALEPDHRAIEASLRRLAPAYPNGVGAIAAAHLTAGGKRVRPLLTCAVVRACGGEPRAIDAIAASELVHAGSLLHDDIIDGATTRRGRPAAHTVVGTHAAVLAGDYLVAWAFEAVSQAGVAALTTTLAVAIRDLVEGEVLERARLFEAGVDLGHARLVNRLKTGALFGYAAEAGALLAGADDGVRTAARDYGLALGEAFQIVDDVLDWEGVPGMLGKPVGQDLLQGTVTIPLALACAADPGLRAAVGACWEALAAGQDPERHLQAVASGVKRTRALVDARDLARAEVCRAVAALGAFPDGPWRGRLARIAEEITRRSA
jgi:octaprenyl-diphosphate synthase